MCSSGWLREGKVAGSAWERRAGRPAWEPGMLLQLDKLLDSGLLRKSEIIFLQLAKTV